MATVEFRYDPKNTAWFTANAAMILKAGEPAYHDTTGLFKLGDGVTALSALSFLPIVSTATPTIQQVLTAGQVATTTIETTGFIKTGGLATEFLKADGTVDSNVYGVGDALTTNPLSQFAATTSSQLASVISDETGTGALVFGTSPTFTTNITTPQITGVSGNLTLTNAIQSSGAITQFTFTNVANTNQTLGTNIPNFRVNGANKQWATGALATQYFNYFTANTVSFVGASTATNVYNLFVEAPIQGTNATITNRYALGLSGYFQMSIGTVASNGFVIRDDVGTSSYTAFYSGVVPSATNYFLRSNATITDLGAGTTIRLNAGGSACFSITATTITTNVNQTFTNGVNLIFGTTTGTKIGTTNLQKLSFWNATPIVQPTTAVAAATVVSGTGGNVKHDDTFDGYTVEKIVRALRTIGLLA